MWPPLLATPMRSSYRSKNFAFRDFDIPEGDKPYHHPVSMAGWFLT